MNGERIVRLYRRILRAYPARWRAHREDEMVAVLTQIAQDEGRSRPTVAETVDLVVHGLRARLAAVLVHVPSVVRERLALLALASAAPLAATALVIGEWPVAATPLPVWAPHFGPFRTTGALAYPAWLIAFGLLLAGRYGGARVAAAVASGTGILLVLLDAVLGWPRPPLFFLAVLTLFGACATQHRAHASSSGRLVAGGIAVAMTAAMVAVAANGGHRLHGWLENFYRGSGLLDIGVASLPVTCVALAIALVLSLRGRPWFGATLIISVPWALLALFTSGPNPYDTLRVVLAAVGAAVVALLGVAVGHRLGVRVRVERVPRTTGG